MELYIKDNLSDITYLSELTPPSMFNINTLFCLEGGVKFADADR